MTCASDVELDKVASQSSVGPNGSFTYTITATNGGTADATGFIISDEVDDLLDIVDATYTVTGGATNVICESIDRDANTIDCGPLTLPRAGGVATVTLIVQATPDACNETVPNRATSNGSDPSEVVTVSVDCADIPRYLNPASRWSRRPTAPARNSATS